MKREPMVFAVGGMLFGFVLGYMVANLGSGPADSARPAAAAPSLAGSADRARPPASPPGLDPNEFKALESLASREKGNVQVRVELGNLLMDNSRFEEAARFYREALALKPDQPDVRVDLGACLVNAGKAGEGLLEFEKTLQKDPTHKKALFNKGIALMETGRTQEAVAVWEGLLKRFPDDPQLQGLRKQIEQVRGAARRPS
ncbi:MAG TPA: tetratricopeptide repeat protein [Vicinamibacteria bacterium]|jgi:cytochrome c-type biogenesis protein CcmH/NrfG|nr:tetratricopeptide repeat protein [Vicinamibacteria bacterium]